MNVEIRRALVNSKSKSNPDLIELFLPRMKFAIDFSKARQPRRVDSHVHTFGHDLRFMRSLTLESFARSSTEVVHVEKKTIWLDGKKTGTRHIKMAELSECLAFSCRYSDYQIVWVPWNQGKISTLTNSHSKENPLKHALDGANPPPGRLWPRGRVHAT